ncbi:la-related protein 1B-like [Silene latifolia]|uniref:la-related protein 1B-like n=1 Tax=Silene latifolia TaxID=37657 RepID=UPI003D775AE7
MAYNNGRYPSRQGQPPRFWGNPPLGFTPFSHPPPPRPFVNPMMPHGHVPYVHWFPNRPFVAPVPFHPALVPRLRYEIMEQINYYFSHDNLIKDVYLRERMDENGWVFIRVIANFNKVKNLTQDIRFILEALRPSTVVEVQGYKIRKRDDWKRWVLLPPA